MLLAAQVEQFLNFLELEQKASPKTVENYARYLKKFVQFAPSVGIADINFELIEKYQDFLARCIDSKTQLPLKIVTRNYFLIALRSFLKYLSSTQELNIDINQIQLAKTQLQQARTLSQQQINALLNSPGILDKIGLRDKSILELLFSTGLLVSELSRLNKEDINFISSECTVCGKGGKKRILPFSASTKKWLEMYCKSRQSDRFRPLFIRHQGKKESVSDGEKMRLTVRSIQRVVQKAAKSAGIEGQVTPHTLRHTLAREMLSKDVATKVVKDTLGHRHLITTKTLYK